jgi:hypothetical protein
VEETITARKVFGHEPFLKKSSFLVDSFIKSHILACGAIKTHNHPQNISIADTRQTLKTFIYFSKAFRRREKNH